MNGVIIRVMIANIYYYYYCAASCVHIFFSARLIYDNISFFIFVAVLLYIN